MLPGDKSTSGIFGGLSEGIGTFLTMLLPGGVALAFWIVLVADQAPKVLNKEFEKTVESVGGLGWGVIVVAALLLAGMVLHIVGTSIEAVVFDRWLDKQRGDAHSAEWYAYLRIAWGESEPIGHRYLRTMVQKMLFELHFACAVGVSALGFVACWSANTICPPNGIALEVLLLHAFGVVWFLSAASKAHTVLAKVRNQLLRGVCDGKTNDVEQSIIWINPVRIGPLGKEKEYFAKPKFWPSLAKWIALSSIMLTGATVGWIFDRRWLLLWLPLVLLSAAWLILVARHLSDPKHATFEWPKVYRVCVAVVAVLGVLLIWRYGSLVPKRVDTGRASVCPNSPPIDGGVPPKSIDGGVPPRSVSGGGAR